MMYFLFGIIIGILLYIAFLLGTLYECNALEREVNYFAEILAEEGVQE